MIVNFEFRDTRMGQLRFRVFSLCHVLVQCHAMKEKWHFLCQCWAGVSRHTGLHLAPERTEVERTVKSQVTCFEKSLGTGSLKVGKI